MPARQKSATSSTSTTTILLSSSSNIVAKSAEDILNDEDVARVMERKLGTKDFRVKHWSLDPVPEVNGFLGQYYHLCVTCSVNDNKTLKKFVFFAKTNPPCNRAQFDFAIRNNVMNKEITVYEDLMPRMGAGNGTDWKVDCYLGKKDVMIVLEDATLAGYAMPDKKVPFGYQECTVMLRSLAEFHAKSVILDEKLRCQQNKTIIDVYGPILKQTMFYPGRMFGKQIIREGIEGACSIVDLIEELDVSTKHRIKNRIVKWSWHIPELLRPSDKHRNVICHLDLWANNFMLKRNDAGLPENCCLVDFQCLCYLPPAVDFMFSLYLNTRRNIRNDHFENFAKLYYNCMRNELESEGLDIDTSLSWEQFRESCESYRPLAIIFVTIKQQILLLDLKTDNDFKLLESGRSNLVCPMFATIKEYRERLTENILDINEFVPDDLP